MKKIIGLLALAMLVSGCATMFSDVKIGEMLPGEIVSLSDGNILPMEIEIIRASSVNGKMNANNPNTGEKFQGKYSAILERNVSTGVASSTVYATSGIHSATGSGSGTSVAVSQSNMADANAVLIGDKGTVLNIKMKMQAGYRKSQLHGYGEAEDNEGNKYQVRF